MKTSKAATDVFCQWCNFMAQRDGTIPKNGWYREGRMFDYIACDYHYQQVESSNEGGA